MADKPDFVTAWTEPESAANTNYQPVYPYNNVTQTKGGHSFEMDDTPTRERIRLQHGRGTFLEMHPNGDEVHKIIGDGYTITLGDHNIAIGVDDGNNAKKLNITVYGDAYFKVTGDKIEEIDGNFEQHIKGHYTQTVNKTSTISSFGDMQINAGSSLLGTLEINTPDSVVCSADVVVNGEVIANKIASITRVDAGTGMSAGFLGFVTGLGGVSVGIPVAVPGQIVCMGTISSFTGVSAPLGTFGLSKAVIAGDIVNELLRKIHNHIGDSGGTTSPPVTQEVNVN